MDFLSRAVKPMSFWEKLAYRFGKDPTRKEGGRSPLDKAIFNNDTERLDFFGKVSHLTPEQLKQSIREINNLNTLKKLTQMGLSLTNEEQKEAALRIAKNAVASAKYALQSDELISYLRQNDISLNFPDASKHSFYDNVEDKELFFKKATPEEIRTECYKAFENGDIKKGLDIFPRARFDEKDPRGKAVMMHTVEKARGMVQTVYEMGAKIADEKGNSLLKEGNAFVFEQLLPTMIQRNDINALRAAVKEGVSLKGKIDLANIASADQTEVLQFLALNGAPFNYAIANATYQDIRENDYQTNGQKKLDALNSALAYAEQTKEALNQPSPSGRVSLSAEQAKVLHSVLGQKGK